MIWLGLERIFHNTIIVVSILAQHLHGILIVLTKFFKFIIGDLSCIHPPKTKRIKLIAIHGAWKKLLASAHIILFLMNWENGIMMMLKIT